MPPTRVTRQVCKLRKLMLLFLNIRTKIKGRTCRTEFRTCHKQVVLERLCDISVLCSHCCLMVQIHVTCMFMVVEVRTKF
jgi:hypothetical protein